MIAIEPRYDMARTRELLVTAMNDRCQEVHWRALVGQKLPVTGSEATSEENQQRQAVVGITIT